MTRERQVLSLTVLLLVIGGVGLAFVDKTLPDALIALGGTALGLLRGSGQLDGASAVRIEQPADQPVPVEDTETPATVREADRPAPRRSRR